MTIDAYKLKDLRDELWSRIRDVPGVTNIGVRPNPSEPDGVEFVVHVDRSKLHDPIIPSHQGSVKVSLRDDLPGIAH